MGLHRDHCRGGVVRSEGEVSDSLEGLLEVKAPCRSVFVRDVQPSSDQLLDDVDFDGPESHPEGPDDRPFRRDSVQLGQILDVGVVGGKDGKVVQFIDSWQSCIQFLKVARFVHDVRQWHYSLALQGVFAVGLKVVTDLLNHQLVVGLAFVVDRLVHVGEGRKLLHLHLAVEE